MFNPELDNISTNSSISGGTVTHSATYRMRGTLGVELGSLPVGWPLDYGSHSHSITHSMN